MSDSDDTLAELTRIAQESAQAYFDGDLDTYAGWSGTATTSP